MRSRCTQFLDERPPNAQECEAADCRCWEVVSELRQQGWKVDDALHGVTEVRAELIAYRKGMQRWKGLPYEAHRV